MEGCPGDVSSQLVHDDLGRGMKRLTTHTDAPMVREQDDLGLRRHICKDTQRRCSTIIIELHEDVVDDEGQWFTGGAGSLDGGEA